jgi:hypothetical protein
MTDSITYVIEAAEWMRHRLANAATKYQPCGHPVAAVVSSDEGTAYCSECEREARLMAKMDAWQDAADAKRIALLQEAEAAHTLGWEAILGPAESETK